MQLSGDAETLRGGGGGGGESGGGSSRLGLPKQDHQSPL